MARDIHNVTDDVSLVMREVIDATENAMVLETALHLNKGAKSANAKDYIKTQVASKRQLNKKLQQVANKSQKMLNNVIDNIGSYTGTDTKALKKDTAMGMKMLVRSAKSMQNRTLKKVSRLERYKTSAEFIPNLDKSIISQTKTGIDKGLPVTYKNGRKVTYKAYMEMAVRTGIQQEIGNRQLEAGRNANIVFYVVNEFGDCADDHADYQGRMYYDEGYTDFPLQDEVKRLIQDHIQKNSLLSIQSVRDKEPYLTTRPNCRHKMKPVAIDRVLQESVENIKDDLGYKTKSYRPENYEATKTQRYNERNIRKYKQRNLTYMALYKDTNNKEYLLQAQKEKRQAMLWQKKQRQHMKANPDLFRDYERENPKVLLQDLGLKDKKIQSDPNKPPAPITNKPPQTPPVAMSEVVKEHLEIPEQKTDMFETKQNIITTFNEYNTIENKKEFIDNIEKVGIDTFKDIGVDNVRVFNKDKIDVYQLGTQAKTLNDLKDEYYTRIKKIQFNVAKPFTLGNVERNNFYGFEADVIRVKSNVDISMRQKKARIDNEISGNNHMTIVDIGKENEYLITHEFAHTLYDFQSAERMKKVKLENPLEKFGKEIIKIRKAYDEEIKKLRFERFTLEEEFFGGKIPDFKLGDGLRYKFKSPKAIELDKKYKATHISSYASSNDDEFLAEAFTQAKLSSNPSPYSKQVLEVVDKYFKKGSPEQKKYQKFIKETFVNDI